MGLCAGTQLSWRTVSSVSTLAPTACGSDLCYLYPPFVASSTSFPALASMDLAQPSPYLRLTARRRQGNYFKRTERGEPLRAGANSFFAKGLQTRLPPCSQGLSVNVGISKTLPVTCPSQLSGSSSHLNSDIIGFLYSYVIVRVPQHPPEHKHHVGMEIFRVIATSLCPDNCLAHNNHSINRGKLNGYSSFQYN